MSFCRNWFGIIYLTDADLQVASPGHLFFINMMYPCIP